MIPTPAPPLLGPVVCAPTIAQVFAQQAKGYAGPHAEDRGFGVVFDGNWAYVGWGIGETGGQSVYRRVDGKWCRIANSGGALNRAELIEIAGPEHGARLWHLMAKH
jgi:hypothetical protein